MLRSHRPRRLGTDDPYSGRNARCNDDSGTSCGGLHHRQSRGHGLGHIHPLPRRAALWRSPSRRHRPLTSARRDLALMKILQPIQGDVVIKGENVISRREPGALERLCEYAERHDVGPGPTWVPKVPQGSSDFSEIVDGLPFSCPPIFRDNAGCGFGGHDTRVVSQLVV